MVWTCYKEKLIRGSTSGDAYGRKRKWEKNIQHITGTNPFTCWGVEDDSFGKHKQRSYQTGYVACTQNVTPPLRKNIVGNQTTYDLTHRNICSYHLARAWEGRVVILDFYFDKIFINFFSIKIDQNISACILFGSFNKKWSKIIVFRTYIVVPT